MKTQIKDIVIGIFAVMGFIIFTTSLSRKSDSIYVPHNDGGVLNTQTGMVYYYDVYEESMYSDAKTVRKFTEVDYINKSVKRDTITRPNFDADEKYIGDREFFISK